MVTFQVVPSRGEAFECEALEGMSLKDVAEFGDGPGAELLGEHLECACSGVMACSTCACPCHHHPADPAHSPQKARAC